MQNHISLTTFVHNQRKHLQRFLDRLDKLGFGDELVVVVIGGEDPYELLEAERGFTIKALYMEKNSKEKAITEAMKIAASACQGDMCGYLNVSELPTKHKIRKSILKGIVGGRDGIPSAGINLDVH